MLSVVSSVCLSHVCAVHVVLSVLCCLSVCLSVGLSRPVRLIRLFVCRSVGHVRPSVRLVRLSVCLSCHVGLVQSCRLSSPSSVCLSVQVLSRLSPHTHIYPALRSIFHVPSRLTISSSVCPSVQSVCRPSVCHCLSCPSSPSSSLSVLSVGPSTVCSSVRPFRPSVRPYVRTSSVRPYPSVGPPTVVLPPTRRFRLPIGRLGPVLPVGSVVDPSHTRPSAYPSFRLPVRSAYPSAYPSFRLPVGRPRPSACPSVRLPVLP